MTILLRGENGCKWSKKNYLVLLNLEKKYVVHYRNRRQYLEMGMTLTAVHRGISFYQSP